MQRGARAGRSTLTWTLLVIAAVAIGIPAAAWWAQDRLIFFPQPIGSTRHLPPAAAPLEVVAADGIRLRGWIVAANATPAPTVIYFGGNAEVVSWTLADARWPRDWTRVALNYRGYGDSEGTPGEAALHADAQAVFDAIARRSDVDAQRIVVFGRSLGTGVAVALASARPVAGVVLVSPYDSLAAVGRTHYPFLPVSLLLRHRFDSRSQRPVTPSCRSSARARCSTAGPARSAGTRSKAPATTTSRRTTRTGARSPTSSSSSSDERRAQSEEKEEPLHQGVDARACHRSLGDGGAAPRLSVARGIQAARARRQGPLAAARHGGRRSRRRAGQLVAGAARAARTGRDDRRARRARNDACRRCALRPGRFPDRRRARRARSGACRPQGGPCRFRHGPQSFGCRIRRSGARRASGRPRTRVRDPLAATRRRSGRQTVPRRGFCGVPAIDATQVRQGSCAKACRVARPQP